jgi:hypothetical protein
LKAALAALSTLILLPLLTGDAFSHGIMCGIEGSCGPAARQPDNEILLFLSNIQGFLITGLMAGLSVFGMVVILKNRPRPIHA